MHAPSPDTVLSGTHVRLEPLGRGHVPALLAAAREDPALYHWTFVPRDIMEMAQYVDAATASREAGSALAIAIVRLADRAVIGSSRFFDLERWHWPAGHSQAARPGPDCCEIGYTWLAASAIRTAANSEAKLLMLTHAFESWQVARVCFHTDARNERSRAALEGIGARFEGVLRAHRLASDLTPRDSARYSIVAAEWAEVKQRLAERVGRDRTPRGDAGTRSGYPRG